jgi:hypothetical protein
MMCHWALPQVGLAKGTNGFQGWKQNAGCTEPEVREAQAIVRGPGRQAGSFITTHLEGLTHEDYINPLWAASAPAT